jgi:DNA-binding HxlR family transcriptional regulator
MNYRADPRGPASLGARAAQPGPARVPAPQRPDVAWDDAAGTVALLSGKWVLPVLRVLGESGTRRHNQLHREIGANVSSRSLDATLRRMEAGGLVERRVDPGTPPAVSYRLTAMARSLLSPLAALGRWGSAHPRKQRSPGRSPRSSEPAA